MGGYTKDNMFRLKADYSHLTLELVRYFVEGRGASVILVPHVFGAADDESDLGPCRHVYRALEPRIRAKVHILEEQYDQYELKALIGCCDFFVGSRMHACIGALSQCVPAAGLAYSRKFKGVFASIQMEELAIDLGEYNEESVISKIDRLYQSRERTRARLEERMPVIRESILELFAQVGAR
jgi:polysaccharide pyruvyl transferase WcaK-like protein